MVCGDENIHSLERWYGSIELNALSENTQNRDFYSNSNRCLPIRHPFSSRCQFVAIFFNVERQPHRLFTQSELRCLSYRLKCKHQMFWLYRKNNTRTPNEKAQTHTSTKHMDARTMSHDQCQAFIASVWVCARCVNHVTFVHRVRGYVSWSNCFVSMNELRFWLCWTIVVYVKAHYELTQMLQVIVHFSSSRSKWHFSFLVFKCAMNSV